MLHGRAQQGKDPIKLRDDWIASFNKGRLSVGKDAISEGDVIFPFYGDRLDELIKKFELNDDNLRARGSEEGGKILTIQYEIAQELAAKSEITETMILEEYRGELIDRGPLNWEWVQSILRVLDRTKIGDWSINKFTHDTAIYLNEESIRNIINEIVIDAVGDETAIWVTHSMGTIVGFDVLSKNPQLVVPEFHTLGSPLGVEAVQSRLSRRNRKPDGVGSWFNFYDDRDVVPLYPLTAASGWNLTPPIENFRVKNLDNEDPHNILGYLSEGSFSQNCS